MDYLIFQKINSLAGKSVCWDGLGIFFAEYFGYILLAILILFLLKDYKKYWPIIFRALAAGILSRFIITEIIRFFWEGPVLLLKTKSIYFCLTEQAVLSHLVTRLSILP